MVEDTETAREGLTLPVLRVADLTSDANMEMTRAATAEIRDIPEIMVMAVAPVLMEISGMEVQANQRMAVAIGEIRRTMVTETEILAIPATMASRAAVDTSSAAMAIMMETATSPESAGNMASADQTMVISQGNQVKSSSDQVISAIPLTEIRLPATMAGTKMHPENCGLQIQAW